MLSRLHIENIAVIENADLELDNGFNVLTGETGAGKSILIDSINLALGERVSKDIVRTGASSAHVSAFFNDISGEAKNELKELGYDCEDELLIQRDISADGRGSCRISGRPATVSIVRSIGRMLVNIHGQHDNQALLSPEKHITYLDKFAKAEEIIERYSKTYNTVKNIQHELNKLQIDDSLKERKIDLLKYQINEIESAELKPDEEDDLKARKLRIANAEKITSAVENAYSALNGTEESEGAQEQLSDADESLGAVVDVYPEISDLASRIKGLAYELEDCTSELRGYLSDEDYDPEELDRIEERLDTIFRLKKKYGGSVEAVIDFLENAKAELETIETSDERIQKLNESLIKANADLKKAASELTAKRKSEVDILCKRIKTELTFLDMPQVEFCVRFDSLSAPSPNGCDDVEFLISANPGSPARPLAKIASGGEISRVMLAIKSVLSDCDDIDTLIFDEIDTGVSGRAALKIGNKLKQVASGRQVICITHLAQIASQADRHILIEKQIKDNNTFTHLKNLDYEGRTRELARIIGTEVTETTLGAAAEMLDLSGIKNK